MNAFFLNTEANHLGESPHEIWFAQQRAFVSTKPYGKKLKRLNPSDICLMYVNTCGVMAAGTVLEEWDGKPVDPPQVYPLGSDLQPEYQLPVDWYLKFPDHPIPAQVLRDITGGTPRQAVQRIRNEAAATRLLEYAQHHASTATT